MQTFLLSEESHVILMVIWWPWSFKHRLFYWTLQVVIIIKSPTKKNTCIFLLSESMKGKQSGFGLLFGFFVCFSRALSKKPQWWGKSSQAFENSSHYVCLRAFRFSSVFLGAECGLCGDHSFQMHAENQASLWNSYSDSPCHSIIWCMNTINDIPPWMMLHSVSGICELSF